SRLEDGRPDVRAVPARVPGSVRGALVRAGVTPDPGNGLDSRLSEWLEHRHWTFSTPLPAEALGVPADRRLILSFEALDYEGAILVDSAVVGEFRGSMSGREFDLTPFVSEGAVLTVVFTNVPDGLGQIARTSRLRDWKPRFGYG